MNCLEFRRGKLAVPRRLTLDMEGHAASCAGCRAFAQRVDAAEPRLAAALAVAVPDGLADRILLRRGRRPLAPRLLALAATLLLAAGVGALAWRALPVHDYAAYAIRHVVDDAHTYASADEVPPSEVRAVLASFGGELTLEPREALGGAVRFLGNCPTPEGTGWHFIVETEHGPATLILIPGSHRGLLTQHADGEGLSALARRAGRGHYALVSDSPQALRALDEKVQRGLRWTG